MVTWYSDMLADVDSLLMLVDQIGAHDDRNRPYREVARELRADEFIPVQKAVADLANRVHSAREAASVDEGIAYETMRLLVDLIPYMRYACRTGAYCEGGFGSLVQSIDKVLGSMMMTVRSRMGITDEMPERPW